MATSTGAPASADSGSGPLRRDDELAALHAAALALSEQLDPETALERIMEQASHLVAGSFGYVYLLDETRTLLLEKVAEGPFTPFVGSSVALDEGVAGLVFQSGKVVIENDYRRWEGRQHRLGATTPAAVLGVPLTAQGETIGVLGLSYMSDGETFSPADAALVTRFGQLASLSLERAQLTAELSAELGQRRAAEDDLLHTVARLTSSEVALRRSQEEMARRLSAAAEHRDGTTGRHIERVSVYCELVARKLGLDDATCESLRLASPLHDVGKIGIPDEILLKPGVLTDEERTAIERHAEIGHDMLAGSGSELLDLAATIALTHHERYDGRGYPRRLRGEAIPLEGRIVAVADVFDALTSDRVYRPAFEPSVAIGLMREGRGTQFDPAVLDAFLALDEEADDARASREGPERRPAVSAVAREPERPGRTVALGPRQVLPTVAEDALANAVAEATRELERVEGERETIDRALRRFCEVAGESVLASVYVLDHDRLWCVAQRGYEQVCDGFTLDEGILGRCLRTAATQFALDVRSDPDFIGAVPGLISELALPLAGTTTRGVLNIETRGAHLPSAAPELVIPLVSALVSRTESMGSTARFDLATLARLSVYASSLHTVSELSDFATRTLGRLLRLESAQLLLGERGTGDVTTGFWRRPESELEPLGASELAAVEVFLTHVNSTYRMIDAIHEEIAPATAGRHMLLLPLRVAAERVGTLVGRSATPFSLDLEQAEAATLLVQQTAALIDVAQALRREQRAAITDSLTGLLNRRGFDERLREEIGRAGRTRRPLALLLGDCDDLKRINDSSGHDQGDTVLQAVAGLLRDQKRVTDIAGRLGGDEFALLLPETGTDDATAIAERLQAGLHRLGDQGVTVSFGVAVYAEDGTTAAALLRAADRALYAAKHAGKDRIANATAQPPRRVAV